MPRVPRCRVRTKREVNENKRESDSEKTSLIVYLGNNVDHKRGPQKGKAEMCERTLNRLLVSKLSVQGSEMMHELPVTRRMQDIGTVNCD